MRSNDFRAYPATSQTVRAVRRAADALAVDTACAIEVDRVAPTVRDGGIETAELFFDRSSVLGPYRLEKLLEQCSESSHDLHRRCAELTDFGESERHEIFPARSGHDDGVLACWRSPASYASRGRSFR